MGWLIAWMGGWVGGWVGEGCVCYIRDTITDPRHADAGFNKYLGQMCFSTLMCTPSAPPPICATTRNISL